MAPLGSKNAREGQLLFKSILVTGGAGFIGSHFIGWLLDQYPGVGVGVVNFDKLTYAGSLQNLRAFEGLPNYRFIRADVCDAGAVDRALREHDVDCVVHFAAQTHVDRSIEGPAVFVRTNLMGTQTLLDCCRGFWERDGKWREGVRYLQISTDEVYGPAEPGESFDEDAPLRPANPYSASKAGADLLCRAAFETYGMPVLISRCTNNYGPRQFPEKLIPLMISKALAGERLPVYGDGLHRRDWLHVRDHCAALDLVLRRGDHGQVYNIAGQCERTNLEMVETLLALLAQRGVPAAREQIAFVADRKGHDRRYAINTAKIRRLGWEPRISLAQGLEETVAWYMENAGYF